MKRKDVATLIIRIKRSINIVPSSSCYLIINVVFTISIGQLELCSSQIITISIYFLYDNVYHLTVAVCSSNFSCAACWYRGFIFTRTTSTTVDHFFKLILFSADNNISLWTALFNYGIGSGRQASKRLTCGTGDGNGSTSICKTFR